ncbi:spermidine/putrescine ABC transporter periplasmic-binding protein [Haemophilus influenzae]|uniref:Spermidine/putrescine ABC transporter periplasmic-binding protein n=1 Tax=Haemophilus influenzae TaxID=727 RepID=A0A2X1PWW9_HAEIF|nr:spermidine/putrescine ABC transporter periplasmic-binding protein [Haemophilus influenzae]
MTSDAREVFHVALLLDGKSPNTTNEEDIKTAYERLEKLLPNVATFNSDSPEVPYVQAKLQLV